MNAGELLANYHIVKPIGAGGGGDVFEALDTKLNRPVALKLVDSSRAVLDEARAASALDHPNILKVHNVEVSDDRAFLVTELVRGETLRETLNRHRLKTDEAIDVALSPRNAEACRHDDRRRARDRLVQRRLELAFRRSRRPRRTGAIYPLSVATGERKAPDDPPMEFYGDQFPVFSPDGESIAFVLGSAPR